MVFKTFGSGEVLTSSDVNTYLMKQVNIVCTSATRPASPVEGMVVYETDTDRIYVYDGSAWQINNWFTSSGRVGCRIVRGANQSINNSSVTTVAWDTESLDSDGFVSGSTIQIPSGFGGTYSITSVLTYAAGAGNGHYIQVLTGGVTYRLPGVDADSLQTWTGVIALADGDTVVVQTAQFSGGALNLTGRLEMFLLAR